MASNSDNVVTAEELEGRQITFAEDIPEGADPDAQGFLPPTPGFHVVTMRTYQLKTDEEFKDKGELFVAHKILPIMIDEAGCSVMDFVPLPAKGQIVSARLANQWLQFIKAFGFKAPANRMAPDGFHPKMLIGKQAVIEVVPQFDAEKQQKMYQGRPQVGVAFFGYYPMDQAASLLARNAKPNAGHAATPKEVKTTTAPKGLAF